MIDAQLAVGVTNTVVESMELAVIVGPKGLIAFLAEADSALGHEPDGAHSPPNLCQAGPLRLASGSAVLCGQEDKVRPFLVMMPSRPAPRVGRSRDVGRRHGGTLPPPVSYVCRNLN